MKGKIIVASHRRSGTHLLMAILRRNFGINLLEHESKSHKMLDPKKDFDKKVDKIIYVYRDPRDTLLSCFQWWTIANESIVSNISSEFYGKCFIDYIKGIDVPSFVPNMVTQKEFDLGIISNPMSFWAQHVNYYMGLKENPDVNIYCVKYEDLKQPKTILKIGKWLGLKNILNEEDVDVVDYPVGYYTGVSGKLMNNNSNKWKYLCTDGEINHMNNVLGTMIKSTGYGL